MLMCLPLQMCVPARFVSVLQQMGLLTALLLDRLGVGGWPVPLQLGTPGKSPTSEQFQAIHFPATGLRMAA